MAYVIELPERPDVHLISSQDGERLGVINEIDGEWYWQVSDLGVFYASSLASATAGALAEANRLEAGKQLIRNRAH